MSPRLSRRCGAATCAEELPLAVRRSPPHPNRPRSVLDRLRLGPGSRCVRREGRDRRTGRGALHEASRLDTSERSASALPPASRRRQPSSLSAIAVPTRPVPPVTRALMRTQSLQRAQQLFPAQPVLSSSRLALGGTPMKKALLVSAAVCVLGFGGFAFAAGLATKTVNIRSTGFTPKTVTVVGGDTVRWKNLDTVNHQVVANNGAFASPIVRPNGTYLRRMDTPGTYPYHDALKPTLKGTVRVTGAAPSVTAGISSADRDRGQPPCTSPVRSRRPPSGTPSSSTRRRTRRRRSSRSPGATTTDGLYGFSFTPTILTASRRSRKAGRAPSYAAVALPFRSGRSELVRHQRQAAKSFFRRWVICAAPEPVRPVGSFGRSSWTAVDPALQALSPPRPGLSRIRVYMTTNQAGAGYVFSSSQVISVRRR